LLNLFCDFLVICFLSFFAYFFIVLVFPDAFCFYFYDFYTFLLLFLVATFLFFFSLAGTITTSYEALLFLVDFFFG
jgi:hypothetical protein